LQFLNGYKTYMGGMALMFLAAGSILQGLSDGSDVDWNRAITDFMGKHRPSSGSVGTAAACLAGRWSGANDRQV